MLNVPVKLLAYVAKNNLEVPFKLFLLMKFLCKDGHIVIDENVEKTLANYMGYRDSKLRAIRRSIKKLFELGWIVDHPKIQAHALLSMHKIENLDFQSKKRYPVYFSDIKNIDGILGGAIVAFLNQNFLRKLKHGQVVSKQGGTFTPAQAFLKYGKDGFTPVAINAISKYFQISTTKAHKLKQAAKNFNLIVIIPNVEVEFSGGTDLRLLKLFTRKENYFIQGRWIYFRNIDFIKSMRIVK